MLSQWRPPRRYAIGLPPNKLANNPWAPNEAGAKWAKERGTPSTKEEETLCKHSAKQCIGAAQVMSCHKITQEQRHVLRGLYYALKQVRSMRARKLLLARAYGRVCRDERNFVAADSNGVRRSNLVLCVGIAGTWVGSKITGHLKYGGSQLRKRHWRYCTVAMTNEYITCQTRSSCFGTEVRPQKVVVVIVNGKQRRNSIMGSSVCYNTFCPTYQNGHNTKNRDVEAAVTIAIAGVSTMINGETLPTFRKANSTSQYHTGIKIHRVHTYHMG